MLPSHHMAATVALALPLAKRGWGLPALAAFGAAAVLIDVDHYLSYAWRTGDLSPWRAYAWHRGQVGKWRWQLRLRRPALLIEPHRPFHPIVALALLCLLATRWPVLGPIACGAVFHRFLDYVWQCT
ncbi:MAG: hypothetical protein ACRDI2_03570, partial [Chloroflexota bacterium]